MVPPPKSGLPSWLVVVLVAIVLIGAGYAGIQFMNGRNAGGSEAKSATKAPVVDAAKAHPFARHIEITGLRVVETPKQKLQVQLVIINHSAADLPDLKLRINLRSSKAKPGEDAISSFPISVRGLAAYESKEIKADAATRLRAYEFPDWQFLQADFEVIDK